MPANRNKLPQLGFWDDEVPKVSHDKIVLWAYNNAEQLVRQFLTTFPSRDGRQAADPIWTSSAISIRAGIDPGRLPPLPPKPTTLVAKKTLEKVIQQYPETETGRSLPRILGYADLMITWRDYSVHWRPETNQWDITNTTRALIVEAKTVLPSLGELMRQLNLYRLAYADVIVVAPDNSYQQVLAEQGILFVSYSDDL